VLRGAGLAGAGFVLSSILSLLTSIVIARLITPAQAGEFATAAAVVGLGTVASESGMMAAIVRWEGDIDAAASTAFVSTLASGILVAATITVASPLIGSIFHSHRIEALTLGLAWLLPITTATIVPDALLQRQMSFAS
jgi:O-antigen/teichoic acid export membrane protein